METMPYRDDIDGLAITASRLAGTPRASHPEITPSPTVATSDWRAGLPVLTAGGLTLRELRPSDAPSLFAMLTTEEVSRFISPPPTTVEGFERFIAWTLKQRTAGAYVCFGIVPHGSESAIGLIQVRALDPGFGVAEWGFAIGSQYWGSGIFRTAAEMTLDFTVATLGVHRLEARAAVRNGRGNGALRKLGAVQEAVLRRSFLNRGEYVDQVLWTILASEWVVSRTGSELVH